VEHPQVFLHGGVGLSDEEGGVMPPLYDKNKTEQKELRLAVEAESGRLKVSAEFESNAMIHPPGA
jgi:hypothetical protein